MRPGISITLSPSDRGRLEGIVSNRNALQKHVWRAETVLLSAEGVGTVEIIVNADWMHSDDPCGSRQRAGAADHHARARIGGMDQRLLAGLPHGGPGEPEAHGSSTHLRASVWPFHAGGHCAGGRSRCASGAEWDRGGQAGSRALALERKGRAAVGTGRPPSARAGRTCHLTTRRAARGWHSGAKAPAEAERCGDSAVGHAARPRLRTAFWANSQRLPMCLLVYGEGILIRVERPQIHPP
jgi:hypothetical protein